MEGYSKLLVAVDGSESSLHALKEAFRLSPKGVTAVAVAPPYTGDLRVMGVDNLKKMLREPCDTALAKAQEIAREEKAQVATACVQGEPYEEIVDLAEEKGCELIVMGVRGVSFLERALLGGTTERVIGYSSLDVLVVPLHGTVAWSKVLLATDGSSYSQGAVGRALDFVEAYGSELKVVSVIEVPPEIYGIAPELALEKAKKPRQYVAEVKRQAEARGIPVEAFLREAEFAYRVIIDLAHKQGVDLIIMGSHGRTGLTRMLLGSVTERVIGLAPCPVLVVKTPEPPEA